MRQRDMKTEAGGTAQDSYSKIEVLNFLIIRIVFLRLLRNQINLRFSLRNLSDQDTRIGRLTFSTKERNKNLRRLVKNDAQRRIKISLEKSTEKGK